MPFSSLTTQKHYDLTPKEKEAKAIHIFVDTDFNIENRGGTPIHILAMTEGWRYIRALGYLIDKSFQEQINEVSQIVCTHYAQNKGKIPIFGVIKRYHFRYKADCPAIVFDPYGNIIDESNLVEGHAVLSIDGKDILSLLYVGR